ncbi:hypothetical protein 4 [Beihai sipunculid worm virus 5]|uniref:hypothetical protein 4 n=1 Tax=Beihai sipunculid worm virus 5 TaxID=1922677 RepID=UPI00090C3A29|nr:hypothetical protein 4 [Beihai sipunculid worm virus 5]APG76868.1 hypothetical protein 4 [Beihai sipunculid worm virus 5]
MDSANLSISPVYQGPLDLNSEIYVGECDKFGDKRKRRVKIKNVRCKQIVHTVIFGNTEIPVTLACEENRQAVHANTCPHGNETVPRLKCIAAARVFESSRLEPPPAISRFQKENCYFASQVFRLFCFILQCIPSLVTMLPPESGPSVKVLESEKVPLFTRYHLKSMPDRTPMDEDISTYIWCVQPIHIWVFELVVAHINWLRFCRFPSVYTYLSGTCLCSQAPFFICSDEKCRRNPKTDFRFWPRFVPQELSTDRLDELKQYKWTRSLRAGVWRMLSGQRRFIKPMIPSEIESSYMKVIQFIYWQSFLLCSYGRRAHPHNHPPVKNVMLWRTKTKLVGSFINYMWTNFGSLPRKEDLVPFYRMTKMMRTKFYAEVLAVKQKKGKATESDRHLIRRSLHQIWYKVLSPSTPNKLYNDRASHLAAVLIEYINRLPFLKSLGQEKCFNIVLNFS